MSDARVEARKARAREVRRERRRRRAAARPKPEPKLLKGMGVCLTEADRAAMERAARCEQETLTGLARLILREWLRERGYL